MLSEYTTHPAFQGVLIGLVGVLCFRYKNPNKYLLNWVSGFIFIIFSSGVFLYFTNELVGKLVWGIAALALMAIYSIRFFKKETKDGIDYVKVLGIALIVVYPLSFYSPDLLEKRWYALNGIVQMITPILLTVYIYDRWILKPEQMKRKFIVVLSIQLLVILISFVYAFVQKAIADDNLIQANIARNEAERHRELASVNAEKQSEVARELQAKLAECEKSKSKNR